MKYILLIILLLNFTVEAGQHRSQKSKNLFKQYHPCPATLKSKGSCPGYIIDHVKPLACGGVDSPSNMQWQTKEAAKQKDRWERKGC